MSNPNILPFDSLTDLRSEHSRLLRGPKPPAEGAPPADQTPEVVEFLTRAKATGTQLDMPADREAAQGILDYWTATLFTLSAEKSNGIKLDELIPGLPKGSINLLLEKFNDKEARSYATNAKEWFATKNDQEQRLLQQILMRLVRMPAVGNTIEPRPRAVSELADLGPAVPQLLGELERVQVIRTIKQDAPAPELVALRYDALIREWDTYAEWVKRRQAFRGTVQYWVENKDAKGREEALIRGELRREAQQYNDKNASEDAFLAASQEREEALLGRERFWKWVFAGLAVVAALCAIGSIVLGGVAADQAEKRRQLERAQEAERATLEKAQREAIQAKETFESDSALALALLLMKEQPDAAHVARKILMIQTLGQILFADTPEGAAVVRGNWAKLVSSLAQHPAPPDFNWFNVFLAERDAQVSAIINPATPRRQAQEDLLKFSQDVRDAMGLTDQPPSMRWLPHARSMRPVWFRQVQQATKLIAKAAEEGRPLENTRVLVNLFRRLYYGEMVLVEGDEVVEAMVNVERTIQKWEESNADKPAPNDVRAELSAAAERLRIACESEENKR